MLANRIKYLMIFIVSFIYSVSVNAQMFASSPSESNQSNSVSSKNTGWGKFYNSSQNFGQDKRDANKIISSDTKEAAPKESDKTKQNVVNPKDYQYKQTSQIDRPTLDGVKRGRTSVIPVVTGEEKPLSAEGYIYLFYSDFSVGRMMSGTTTCDVSFIILSTFDRRLNSLAVRLKWPHMDTPVSFIDINPNQKYKMTYTLLGDGCYSMDKIPNVVVNRCRIKGMSQEECARRVRWIRKM